MVSITGFVFNCETTTEIRGPVAHRQLRTNFTESANRATFITRQDVRNIVRKIEDSLKHQHQIDAVSVDRLVKELMLEEDNPIIAYKSQVFLIFWC